MYRLFDGDEDGSIGKQDLIDSLSKLVEKNLPANEIRDTVDIMLEEIGGNKEKLDKDDFQKILWVTDFDQKLNIARFSV